VQPRYYQAAANEAAWSYMASGAGNPLIVLPTGAGKSLVIALLVRQALAFNQQVLVLAHRKELLQQNAEKIETLVGVSVGLNSAGLRQHDFDSAVICAGIQSVYRKAWDFGARGLVLIDEAHLISDDDSSMYGQFLEGLQVVNRRLFACGLTATPYRTGEGCIAGDGKLFSGVCYEAMTGQLIGEGWLAPLTNTPAEGAVDMSGVARRGGEFVQADMERAFSGDDKVLRAVCEIVALTEGRRSVIVFCAGVMHAEQVAQCLREITRERVECVTGDTPPDDRKRTLEDFRSGLLRWCVNVDVLTTGFDCPRIDAIAVLRATMSPGLFAQIVGRGLRKTEGKADCLVLDFGGNISRHGSLDSPDYGRYTGGRGHQAGERIETEGAGGQKICPKCGTSCAARSAFCPECGNGFPVNHEETADLSSQITGKPEPEAWTVERVTWSRHVKKDAPEKPPTLRVNYEGYPADAGPGNLSRDVISEWVCVEHEGFAGQKAFGWWQCRSAIAFPQSVEAAIDLLDAGACRQPSTIWVVPEGKWKRIARVEFSDEIPDKADVQARMVDGLSDDDVPF